MVTILVVARSGLDGPQVKPLDRNRDALGVGEIPLRDRPEDRLLVDDVIPNHIQWLVVSAVEGGGEADSFGRPADRPQAPHDIDCGVRGGAVRFIVQHDISRQKLFDPPRATDGLDRADAYVRRDHVLRRLDDADEHERVSLLELVDGLLDELVTVNDHRHALPALDRPAGDLREDHRLAGAGRQGHGRVLRRVVGPVLLNRLDTLELIWPELHFPLLTKNRATTLIVAYSHALALFMAGPFGIGSVWWISLYSSKDGLSSN